MTSNSARQQTKNEIWYRVGMVWFAIGLPAIVVVASLITVVIAHMNAPIITETNIQTRAEP